MKTLISLYLSFFKIGLFGFGGGYAMISLIQDELQKHGWLSLDEFIDVIAIAEMTPGPIAINSGTFVGFKISSLWGAIVATIGVVTPSFILVIILASTFKKFSDSLYLNRMLKFLQPVIIGLIIAVAFSLSRVSIVDFKGVIICLVVLITMIKTEIHPILIIIMSGLSGALLY
ncbi:MAG: chromate transporter [Firmicutes bacterium]|nr:chromate transporter [Bacillota bacterium]